MKNKLLLIAMVAITSFSFAQTGKTIWKATTKKTNDVIVANKQAIKNPKLFELDVNTLQILLAVAPQRFSSNKSNVTLSFPNADGQLELYRIQESSNMDPALAGRYPEINR